MEMSKADWNTLFEPYQFFESYKNYLQIDITAENDVDLRQWKGWVESRLRQLTLKIERNTNYSLQCHPHPGDFSDKYKLFHSCYFMGLQRNPDIVAIEGKYFDIRATVEDFKGSVNIYTLWKPGMEIRISHIRRRNIPLFVFPGGVRRSRPAKAAWEGRPVSKAKVSNSMQTEIPCNGTVEAVDGADSGKKRKEADNGLETNSGDTKRLSLGASPNGERSQSLNPPDKASHNLEVGPGIPVRPSLPTLGPSYSKEAEKAAIENISGVSVGSIGFPNELDELDDESGLQQTKAFEGDVKDSEADHLTAEETDVVGNGIGAVNVPFQNGGLEELEPVQPIPFSTGYPAPTTTTQRKPLIRLSSTSIAKSSK